MTYQGVGIQVADRVWRGAAARNLCGLFLSLIAALTVLIAFHDEYWYYHDEGIYAHVAERIAGGEVLHKDIQDIHPGYGAFMNALSVKTFGDSSRGLRMGVACMMLLQAGIVCAALASLPPLIRAFWTGTVTLLAWPLFLGPAPMWYALPLALLAYCVVDRKRGQTSNALLTLGALIGTCFLIRQLNGVVLAVGVVPFLVLGNAAIAEPRGDRGLAKAFLLVTLVGMGAYVVVATDVMGWVLFGAPTAGVLMLTLGRPLASNRLVARRTAQLVLGVLLATFPMVVYLTWTGSWGWFVSDVFVNAVGLTRMDLFEGRSYTTLVVTAVLGMCTLKVPIMLASVFWLVLLTAPLTLLLAFLRRERAGQANERLLAGVALALGTSLLAVHYPGLLYLAGGTLLSVVAALRNWPSSNRRMLPVATLLVLYGWVWQAGRSPNVWGREIVRNVEWSDPMVQLHVSPSTRDQFQRLAEFARGKVKPGETIFAFPARAELYLLTGGRNPTRFYSLAQGVATRDDVDRLIALLERDPPKLVAYDPSDVLWTPFALPVAEWAARNAVSSDRVSGVWFYTMR